ncbi:hypothetical protein AGMMS49545_03480 [Betaproteobacteria bacterium]|nr:hypothetical protein AGMMS49545_03480 [Betaproteobacteria bacterium]GHU46183.1 hypothetical protein AGMMS50289_18980 [Betaproteobacteria bacterium]
MKQKFHTLLALSLLSLLPLPVWAQAGGDFSTPDASREAYSQIPWQRIPENLWDKVRSGRALVRQTWVISPSIEPRIAGLGPTYNRPACISCHPRNGRGEAPATQDEPMRSMLVRLSIPGKDAHGGPNPEPAYGDQLNEFGIPGVPGEGEACLEWETRRERLAGGGEVELRAPKIRFRQLAHGALHSKLMTSARVAPPIFGLGLLEAVPEADILALAKAQKAARQGVQGQANYVWDAAQQRHTLGRFGLKANQPTVRQQIAGALAGDMGITSELSPVPNCPPAQTACAAIQGKIGEKHPELSAADLDEMTLYHYILAVPEPRRQDEPQVKAGRALFAAAGCVSCHQPELKTGAFPAFPALGGQTIHPYTDLLLHDMGQGLADNRPDYRASGRQWRTPPLWGIGLAQTVNGHAYLLHDGRARNFLEAILWHDGEARKSKERVRRMSTAEREALLAFLEAL